MRRCASTHYGEIRETLKATRRAVRTQEPGKKPQQSARFRVEAVKKADKLGLVATGEKAGRARLYQCPKCGAKGKKGDLERDGHGKDCRVAAKLASGGSRTGFLGDYTGFTQIGRQQGKGQIVSCDKCGEEGQKSNLNRAGHGPECEHQPVDDAAAAAEDDGLQ
jgi:predicted RNA-binding Zn-ribbon protein involved in translation (DUF1610 family)